MDIPASTIAQYDQRLAAIKDHLNAIIAAHRKDIANHGDAYSTIGLAGGISERAKDDPMHVTDLLAVAINRLANLEDE
jgi:hypothetical protein